MDKKNRINWLSFSSHKFVTESISIKDNNWTPEMFIYIYIERERERSMANMLSVVFRPKYNQFIFQFLKSKKSIQTVRCVLHIEMCLETKFYIFWNFLLFIKPLWKSRIQRWLNKQWNRWISDFQSGLINSKKIQKM